MKKTPMYQCKSWYDDDNSLRDCTCGRCGKKPKKLNIDKLLKAPHMIIKIEEYDDVPILTLCGFLILGMLIMFVLLLIKGTITL
jgi:hypothetical protein